MAPVPDRVQSDLTLPKSADVVVIGGGIIGATTALELAERGVDVVLLEKGEIAGEQSSRNWGWCRQMGRDVREIPLILESMRLWRNMNVRVSAETGFNQCGILYLCKDERQMARNETWLEEHARPYQLDSRMVGADEVAELVPGAAIPPVGALYTPSDGRGEPQKAAPAIANAVRSQGGKVFTQCAVRGLETKAGRAGTVVTERGSIEAGSVVLAGGAWSRHFCDRLGIVLPQLTTISSVLRTEPLDAGLERSVGGDQYAFRKRLDGGYTIAHGSVSVSDITPAHFRFFRQFMPALKTEWDNIKLRLGPRFSDEWSWSKPWKLDEVSPFEKVRTLDPAPVDWVVKQSEDSIKRHYPVFQNMKVAERWAGCIDVTPDVVPVISEVEQLPGFFLSTGFSGHGFGIGPGAGRLTADLVTGKAPVVDPEPFRYSRMIDGTKFAPMALP
ncbi:MAG: FAD-binding oxidoreductase [Pseudomonadota bacterium]